jgi:hypothetical protein
MATPERTDSGTATPSTIALVYGEVDNEADGAYAFVPWAEIERRARRRRLVICACVACTLLALVLAAVLWNANSHYSRGRAALASGRYATAVEEFAAARFFTLPYRDAATLSAKAQRSVAEETAAAASERRRRAAVTRLLEKADASLAQGNAAGAIAAINAARRAVPDGPLPLEVGSAGLTTRLTRHIRASAGLDLASGHWRRAADLASAWLALRPADTDATALLATARSSVTLQAMLARARAAAAAGRWRTARRLARAVLDARRGFPGAAAVVAQASAALARKAAPKAAATTSPAANSNPAAATPAAPPPP